MSGITGACTPRISGSGAPAADGGSGAAREAMPTPPSSQDGLAVIGPWPLRDFLELGALPGAVPCARRHTRQILWEWRLTALADPVELVVSELATNAVAASRLAGLAPAIRLWLLADAARVLVLVWDASPRPPARADTGVDAEGGRGLLLVEAVSSRWGWYRDRQGETGKVVWAELGDRDTAAAQAGHN